MSSTSRESARERLHFTALANEILDIILIQIEEESPRSLWNLARASKFCKKFADPFLYRSIELSDKDTKLKQTEQFVRQLLDPNDDLRWHVKDLRITGCGTSRGDRFDTLVLEQVLDNIVEIKSFSWDTKAAIPETVIWPLENRWPNARLCVTNTNTDLRLVSSPLLHSLTHNIQHYGGEPAMLAFPPKIKEAISKSARLKVLHATMSSGYTDAPVPPARRAAHFQQILSDAMPNPSDKLPPLHELTLGPHFRYWHIGRQCRMLWTQCIDCSQLRRLNLRHGCPETLLEQLEGNVLNLKSLTLGVNLAPQDGGTLSGGDPSLVQTFIESIDGLHELSIINYCGEPDFLFSAVLKHHESLQTLSFHTPPDQHYRRKLPPVWAVEQLLRLRDQCRNLSVLELDVVLEEGQWSWDTAGTLVRFNRLQTLKISVEIPMEASDFSEKEYVQNSMGTLPMPPWREDLGKSIACELFRKFYEHDPYSHLKTLEFRFTRLEVSDRAQALVVYNSIFVRRLERDDAPRPEDGGFAVECEHKWPTADVE